MVVVGIDCSTEPKKIGLARGEFSESSGHQLLDVDRLISAAASYSLLAVLVMSCLLLAVPQAALAISQVAGTTLELGNEGSLEVAGDGRLPAVLKGLITSAADSNRALPPPPEKVRHRGYCTVLTIVQVPRQTA